MPMYEYRCTSCGDQIVDRERLEEFMPVEEYGHIGDSATPMTGDMCGPLKRTWSVGFQIKSTDWGH